MRHTSPTSIFRPPNFRFILLCSIHGIRSWLHNIFCRFSHQTSPQNKSFQISTYSPFPSKDPPPKEGPKTPDLPMPHPRAVPGTHLIFCRRGPRFQHRPGLRGCPPEVSLPPGSDEKKWWISGPKWRQIVKNDLSKKTMRFIDMIYIYIWYIYIYIYICIWYMYIYIYTYIYIWLIYAGAKLTHKKNSMVLGKYNHS